MELDVKRILDLFPLRISITDYCNLKCFFCSNEGMDNDQRNSEHVDVGNLDYLIGILKKNGLKHISLTGGDPTQHPKLETILQTIAKHRIERIFFHTNGVELDSGLSGYLDDFSKIAVSIHAFDYDSWKKITRGKREQYQQLVDNLHLLGKKGFGQKVEIKHVPLDGINTSNDHLRETLEFCSTYNFKFKFLNFEPIEEYHSGLVVPIQRLTRQLEEIGCKLLVQDINFRGQSDYLPIKRYEFGDTKGVAIEIGCGDESVCKACYKSNEIFLTPSLQLKPCHIDSKIIPLKSDIINQDENSILTKIIKSRELLYQKPGARKNYWNQGD